MSLDNVFYNGQTKPCPPQFPASGLVHPVKSFKQSGQMLLGNAGAEIPYRNGSRLFRFSDFDKNPAAGFAVFDGIINQIGYGLFKKRGVYLKEEILFFSKFQNNPSFIGLVFCTLKGSFDHFDQIAGFRDNFLFF